MLRLITACLGAVLLLVPIAAAADVPPGTALAPEQVFRYRVSGQAYSFDPQLVQDLASAQISMNLFEGLVVEGDDGNVAPGIAGSWDVSPDGLTYTFHLGQSRWSDATPLVADDFVFGWRRAVDPATASPYGYFVALAGVKNAKDILAGHLPPDQLGVVAPDPLTLVVTLEAPARFFPQMLSQATFFPVPRHVIAKNGARWTEPGLLVSNGAYFLSEYRPGEITRLKRNHHYWNDAQTVIRTVEFITVSDPLQAVTRYLAGELDYSAISMSVSELPQAATADLHMVPMLCTNYLAINLTASGSPALQDVRVRRALWLAVDRQMFVDKIMQGAGVPAYTFTPPFTAGFAAPDLPEKEMSQAEREAMAKQLLREAGYGPDRPLRFEMIVMRSPGIAKPMTALAQMYRQVLGAEVKLREMEFSALLTARQERTYEVSRSGWCADFNEPTSFLSQLISPGTTRMAQNDPGYSNRELDALMASARGMADPSPAYARIETMIARDVPVIPLFHQAEMFLLKPSVGGWPMRNVEDVWYARQLYKVAP